MLPLKVVPPVASADSSRKMAPVLEIKRTKKNASSATYVLRFEERGSVCAEQDSKLLPAEHSLVNCTSQS